MALGDAVRVELKVQHGVHLSMKARAEFTLCTWAITYRSAPPLTLPALSPSLLQRHSLDGLLELCRSPTSSGS